MVLPRKKSDIRLPSKKKIFYYWTEKSVDELFEKIGVFEFDWMEPQCMGCGFFWDARYDAKKIPAPDASIRKWQAVADCWERAPVQRCHIVPRSLGGSDEVSNLVLMCKVCHDLSPDVTDPAMFFAWTKRQNWLARDYEDIERAFRDLGIEGDELENLKRVMSEIHNSKYLKERLLEFIGENAGVHGHQHVRRPAGITHSSYAATTVMFCREYAAGRIPQQDASGGAEDLSGRYRQQSFVDESPESNPKK